MKVIHVPASVLLQASEWWVPHARRVAARDGRDPNDYVNEALAGQADVFVILDGERPIAAAGASILLRNDKELIGDLVWLAGEGIRDWLPQFVETIERHLKAKGCVGGKFVARPGFARALKRFGYTTRKVVLEKRF